VEGNCNGFIRHGGGSRVTLAGFIRYGGGSRVTLAGFTRHGSGSILLQLKFYVNRCLLSFEHFVIKSPDKLCVSN